jgi:hypothetical protein
MHDANETAQSTHPSVKNWALRLTFERGMLSPLRLALEARRNAKTQVSKLLGG